MSFARFGWDGSDVYVFPTSGRNSGDAYECCGCYMSESHAFPTAEGIKAHLDQHRATGDIVPQGCYDGIDEWEATTKQRTR